MPARCLAGGPAAAPAPLLQLWGATGLCWGPLCLGTRWGNAACPGCGWPRCARVMVGQEEAPCWGCQQWGSGAAGRARCSPARFCSEHPRTPRGWGRGEPSPRCVQVDLGSRGHAVGLAGARAACGRCRVAAPGRARGVHSGCGSGCVAVQVQRALQQRCPRALCSRACARRGRVAVRAQPCTARGRAGAARRGQPLPGARGRLERVGTRGCVSRAGTPALPLPLAGLEGAGGGWERGHRTASGGRDPWGQRRGMGSPWGFGRERAKLATAAPTSSGSQRAWMGDCTA